MGIKDIIIECLGLQEVKIEDIKLFRKDLRLEVVVRQDRSKCRCEQCGEVFKEVKDWDIKILRGPPLGIYQVVRIKFFQLRGKCRDCKVTSVYPALFIHNKFSSLTNGFAEVAGRLMEEITCEAVGRLLKAPSKLMWSLDQHRMKIMMQYLALPDQLDASHLSADEVHFLTKRLEKRKGLVAKRWEPKFLTNLVCVKEGKVLWSASGRDSRALSECVNVLSDRQLSQVKYFATDLHDAFIKVAKSSCQNAQIVVDRFHLVQNLNRAFDELRKSEFKRAKQTNDRLAINMLEPHRRFILVSKEKYLSKSEEKLLTRLRFENSRIHEGMLVMEYFHKMMDSKTVKGFRGELARWYLLVRESKLLPFVKFAKTIKRYRRMIEPYIESKLTTAVSEGINNKIKVLIRMAYNYTNETSLKRKILQRCGFLNSKYINTNNFFYFTPKPR